jgi:MFS family permease
MTRAAPLTAETPARPAPFQRGWLTWLNYLMLAFYAYGQSAISPIMPFLSAEQGLSYTVRALHLSAFALGMIIAGLTAERAAARFRRDRLFWGGGLGMIGGLALLAIGQHPAVTIAATLIAGTVGSYTLVMVQAVLADIHGERRTQALTEANVVASMASAVVPLVVATAERGGLGWRAALIVSAVSWLLLFAAFRRARIPAATANTATANTPAANTPAANTATANTAAHPMTGTARRRPLPRIFWLLCAVVFLAVSVEWSVLFWGAEFLETSVGLARVDASSLMSVFLGAMVAGRLLGSRLAGRFGALPLLRAAFVCTAVGFPLFWLGGAQAVHLLGLFTVGLGVANLFPLALSAATSAAPDQINKASGRVSFAAGSAVLVAPQVLGTVGDVSGIEAAFALVAGLIAVALLLVFLVRPAGPGR